MASLNGNKTNTQQQQQPTKLIYVFCLESSALCSTDCTKEKKKQLTNVRTRSQSAIPMARSRDKEENEIW